MISFNTIKLKDISYKSSDLSSMLSMYNPSIPVNIAKNSKAKQDNAKVTYH